jgi:uncharacterized protein (TIGR03790 family)
MQGVTRIVASCLLAGRMLASAGGGPLHTLVVVNDRSAASLEAGRYYADRRGIPDRNIFHISTAVSNSATAATFSNDIRGPVLAYLASSGLSNQIDAVVFSRDIPYRIYQPPYADLRHSGLTAAMYHDLISSPNAFTTGCDLASGSAQDYFGAERYFTRDGAPVSNRYYLSALLTAYDLDGTKRLADRAVRAESTCPTSSVFLLHTADKDRNIQWRKFDETDFLMRFLPAPQQRFITDEDCVAQVSNVVGYLLGSASVCGLNLVGFAPGAYTEHLTSYGGFLFDPPGQMSILDWIRQGSSGSYGTVVEPCAYTNKFSTPVFYFWYARGFSLGESHWMSVQSPYQGIFVGDPLCSPCAVPPQVALGGLAGGVTVTGDVSVSVAASTAAAAGRVDQIDLFLDGRLIATVTNVQPAAGNLLGVAANGVTSQYEVAGGDTIFSAALGLAAAINAGDAGVVAEAFGDRIELVATNLGVSVSHRTYSAWAAQGTSAVLTVSARAATSNFLDGAYPAREFIELKGTARNGDTVTCRITLTNGVTATNLVVAAAGETALNVMTQLMGVINANPALAGPDGAVAKYLNYEVTTNVEAVLQARSPGPPGFNLLVDYTIARASPHLGLGTNESFSGHFDDNVDVLRGRGEVFLSAGRPALTTVCALATTSLPDGPHELCAVAYEGSALKTQGRAIAPFSINNNSITCVVARPLPLQSSLRGAALTAEVSAATGDGAVTQVVLYAEGKLFARTGAPPYAFAIPTTNFGAGPLTLQARADSDAGDSALSESRTVHLFTDEDADGMSDQWEYLQFGSMTNAVADGDPDGDGVGNADEYLADTPPTNGASYLRIAALAAGDADLVTFATVTTRLHRVEYTDQGLEAEAVWQSDEAGHLPGGPGLTTRTNAPGGSLRAYRIGARAP